MASLALGPDVHNSHLYDMELCELLHSLEAPNIPEVVKRTVRTVVRDRVEKLGMKYDDESIRQYRISFHDHDPQVHLQPNFVPELSERSEFPDWARELIQGMLATQHRLDHTVSRIGGANLTRTGSISAGEHQDPPSELGDGDRTYTNDIGTISDGFFHQPDTGIADSTTIRASAGEDSVRGEGHDDREDDEPHDHLQQEVVIPTQGPADNYMAGARNDSPERRFLGDELYKLRVKPGPGPAIGTHNTWEIVRANQDFGDEGEDQAAVAEFVVSEIPDSTTRQGLPPPPAIPQGIPPWRLFHQLLLNWATVWSMTELDAALESTTSGHQVDDISLSIWAIQSYKRYVRSRMKDSPQRRVDRLFVPPHLADAINTAVLNGRYGNACRMLRGLWTPFGLDGIPRLLIVLARCRADANHWVTHKFSLPDGQLTTYHTFPHKCSPDSISLRWWFAIRIAWPDANCFNLDDLTQKIVRLYRPPQLEADNSVAAAGIWMNLLMGSRARDRMVDLERLRESINAEVKGIRQIKWMGKLPKPNWD